MTPESLDILVEDGPCLLVNKPGGLLTQAPPGIDSMEVRLKRYLQARDPQKPRTYLGVPHRLDRPASGVMVFGTTARATRRLAEQFEGRTVEKQYWAVVEGVVEPQTGTWSDFVRKVPGEARAEVVAEEHEDSKSAVLHYRVRRQWDSFSWLEIRLETGRTHQIRIQAASRKLPIVGDELYGATQSFGPQTTDLRQRCIALHARSLSIRHPKTQQPLSVIAELSAGWHELGVDPTHASTE